MNKVNGGILRAKEKVSEQVRTLDSKGIIGKAQMLLSVKRNRYIAAGSLALLLIVSMAGGSNESPTEAAVEMFGVEKWDTLTKSASLCAPGYRLIAESNLVTSAQEDVMLEKHLLFAEVGKTFLSPEMFQDGLNRGGQLVMNSRDPNIVNELAKICEPVYADLERIKHLL